MINKWVSLFSLIILTSCSFPGFPQEETSPIVTIYVGPQKAECDNPLRHNECYQVKDKPEKEWELYKGEIMGLQYDPNFIYEIQVQKDSLSQNSQNAPDQQWVLIKLVQKVSLGGEQGKGNNEIAGSVWTLDQFGSPQTLQPASGEMPPTILFQPDGHFTGSTGCNRFNGTYSTENSNFKAGSLAATKKMCSGQPGLLEQEQTILKTLEQAERYQIDNGKLSIIAAGDSSELIFKK
jgi:heat shock protein HslJ